MINRWVLIRSIGGDETLGTAEGGHGSVCERSSFVRYSD